MRVRRADGGVALERHVVLGFDHLRRACERRVGIADDARRAALDVGVALRM